MIGNLGFSQTNLSGKFARAQMRPLYKKSYSRSSDSALSPNERDIFLVGKFAQIFTTSFPSDHIGQT